MLYINFTYILGFVSPVRNQGGCGSCAAFAAVGAAESSLLKAGAAASTLDLAEQWLVDCKPDNYNWMQRSFTSWLSRVYGQRR